MSRALQVVVVVADVADVKPVVVVAAVVVFEPLMLMFISKLLTRFSKMELLSGDVNNAPPSTLYQPLTQSDSTDKLSAQQMTTIGD